MRTDVFVVNAFSENIAEGNPAGVVICEEYFPDDILQKIAIDIGKSETAFIIKQGEDKYRIRWFSPKKEMPICGHATLAAAKVIFEMTKLTKVFFQSSSDLLVVEKERDEILTMDFPIDNYTKIPIDDIYFKFFPGIAIEECIIGIKTRKVVLKINEDSNIELIKPEYDYMVRTSGIYTNGIGITKKSKDYDFESRYFNPWAGVNEDPITGSVHTVLSKYWGEILEKDTMLARQSSNRPGIIGLRNQKDRVYISGKGKIVITGEMHL
jgi:PhzF family phenazine biosynthesis protein